MADWFAEGDDGQKTQANTSYSWLGQHLISGYIPAWHQPLGDGTWDIAVATVGLSRWQNHYLEGLAWLLRNVQIDGIYLDGLAMTAR